MVTCLNKDTDIEYTKLVKYINWCHNCELASKTTGFKRDIGDGPLPCDLLFVAEAFGHQEKDIGLPLVGESGLLFRKVLSDNDIGTEDHNILCHLCNTISCYVPPPEGSRALNGTPTVNHINACKTILWSKISLCKPRFIFTLGAISTKNLLSINDDNFKISSYIGKWYEKEWKISGEVHKIQIVPMFHPSYVLRKGGFNNKELIGLYHIILQDVKRHL